VSRDVVDVPRARSQVYRLSIALEPLEGDDGVVTLNQHREIPTLAGWIALLIACVAYDSGDRQAAESTRQAALSLGTEADHAEIKAWAHEPETQAYLDQLHALSSLRDSWTAQTH
jgi:hypothetical protein